MANLPQLDSGTARDQVAKIVAVRSSSRCTIASFIAASSVQGRGMESSHDVFFVV
jgi:hypothetical protein